MNDFEVYFGAPAYSIKCDKLIVINYLNDESLCNIFGRKVIFYDPLPSIKTGNDARSKTIFEWNKEDKKNFVIYDVNYFCPKRHK